MSWHFSRALVAAFSGASSSGGEPFAPSRSCHSAATSSCSASATDTLNHSPCGMTCEPSTEGRGAELLTWFLADSRARTSANAAKEQGLTANAPACGPTWRESSVRFDRASCSWRTHRLLWDEGLPESSVILPVWGRMNADGVVLERTTVPLPTSARDAGLSECWPTPLSRDWKDTPGMALEGVNPDGSERDRTDTLPRAVWSRAKRMWPTPRAEEGGPDFAKAERGKRTGQSVSPSLATAVALEDGPGLGPLNPTFREWLMGWPIDWTARKPLATDKFHEWWRGHGRR